MLKDVLVFYTEPFLDRLLALNHRKMKQARNKLQLQI